MRHRLLRGPIWMTVMGISAYIFAMFQGGFVSWFLFYTCTALILYTWLLVIAFLFVRIERHSEREYGVAGDTFRIRYTVHNPFRFPLLYVQIREEVPAHLKGKSIGTIAYLGIQSAQRVLCVVDGMPRGVYSWNTVHIQTSDLFGFCRLRRAVRIPIRWMIYPKYEQISEWKTLNRHNRGDRYTVHDPLNEDMTLANGIRSYVPGDRLSRIHWKATARTGMLRTKEFAHQVTNSFLIVLDRNQEAYENQHGMFEQSVSVAASVVDFASRFKFQCGLISIGAENVVLPLNHGDEHRHQMMAHLTKVDANGSQRFEYMLPEQLPTMSGAVTVVVISPRLHPAIIDVVQEQYRSTLAIEWLWVRDRSEELRDEEYRLVKEVERRSVSLYCVGGRHYARQIAGGDRYVSA